MKKKIILENKDELLDVLGEQDKNVRLLEKKYGVKIFYYENDKFVVEIVGKKPSIMNAYAELARKGSGNKEPERETSGGFEMDTGNSHNSQVIYVTHTGRPIKPLSSNQEDYVRMIDNNDIVIGIGPAGTGKTFLGVAKALSKLDTGEIRRIVLTRPVVESGEKLGFLPGDLYEKINPYLKPLYDAFIFMLGMEKFKRLNENEIIEIVPLAYMRGRTLENAFIILDEAQNTVPEQMKMFLTRLGVNSQLVITGDITQIDLDRKNRSGLVLITEILRDVKGIKFVSFTEKDVVRHRLVREIIKAYDNWEKKNSV